MKNRAELYASGIDKLLKYKFAQKRMTGWFEYQELKMEVRRHPLRMHPAHETLHSGWKRDRRYAG